MQLYAFDILALDGEDLRGLPLSLRKTNLARLLERRPDGIFVAPCLHDWSRGANYYECRYTSLPQCDASASGRAAGCVINPYFAGSRVPAGRPYRRVY